MRELIVSRLNELLEYDHDTVAAILAVDRIIPIGSDLTRHRATFIKSGVPMTNALELFGFCLDGSPIEACYEGDLIKEFI
jgi:hypothetical protein